MRDIESLNMKGWFQLWKDFLDDKLTDGTWVDLMKGIFNIMDTNEDHLVTKDEILDASLTKTQEEFLEDILGIGEGGDGSPEDDGEYEGSPGDDDGFEVLSEDDGGFETSPEDDSEYERTLEDDDSFERVLEDVGDSKRSSLDDDDFERMKKDEEGIEDGKMQNRGDTEDDKAQDTIHTDL